jgi:large subunit ribosomal protein L15
MNLNSISPAPGSKKVAKRVGRGIGSGLGKTGGRGHKGLKSRSGGSVAPGFEGGQQPLQRRLPKFGFTSRKACFSTEVRLDALQKLGVDSVNLEVLKKAKIINSNIKVVKVIASGEITSAVTLSGLLVTSGAKNAIEAAGGKVEE